MKGRSIEAEIKNARYSGGVKNTVMNTLEDKQQWRNALKAIENRLHHTR